VTIPVEQTRAILAAYQLVMQASWPDLHPTMAERSRHWATAGAETLEAELEGYLRETLRPNVSVRVFWKLAPKLVFGGCNEHFARDAGLGRAELIGLDDLDPKLPWVLQGAKYRADDQAVIDSDTPKLGIIERQRGATGTITWVHAGKAPIKTADGAVIGVFGMYELLDDETGRRLFADYSRKAHKAPETP
jgi:hypothetical protein